MTQIRKRNNLRKRLFKKSLFPVVLFFMFYLLTLPAFSQDKNKMLMAQVKGNNYVKKDYNRNDELVNHQLFQIGKLKKTQQGFVLPVLIVSYDENGEVKDSIVTKYTCRPDDKKIFMNIFTLAHYDDKKKVKINVLSKNELYPIRWESGKFIDPVLLELNIEGGILGFLGTRSRIEIKDRKVNAHEESKNTYTITAGVHIKSYMFGIKMNTTHYTVEEVVHPREGIKKQTFQNDNGQWFTIEREEGIKKR